VIHDFGDFELDTTRRLLLTRPGGQPVEITGRVLDALIYFVERPGQLIEKKALMDALWPNVIVEEGNLSQTIHTLRKVLGEKAGEHRYIATVPGRGYQFVAEVSSRETLAPSADPLEKIAVVPMSRTQRISAGITLTLAILAIVAVFIMRPHGKPAVVAAPIAQPSIAVLPFVDMSTEQDQAHFAEGLSEEILNLLAHAENLRVIARTSSFSFRDENADIKTIAKRLDVTHVLEGSVRKSGGHLRIVAQLIDASTSAHVWSDSYDRDEHDIFGVQREIATAVAGALRVKLARAEPRRAETTSTEAYEHYLEGRLLFNRRSGNDLPQAKAHFEQAVKLDPNYARAWAGLAGACFVIRYEKFEIPDLMETWRVASEHAVALGPDLAEAHVRMAQYEMNVGKYADAKAHFARAQVLDPEDSMVLSISLGDAIYDGRMQEALEVQRRMVAIDPLSGSQRSNLGAMLMMVGRLNDAQAEFEHALELSPASNSTMQGIADVLIVQGRMKEALPVIARMPDDFQRDLRLALVHYKTGQSREGDASLLRLEGQTKRPYFDRAIAVAIAEVHVARGDADQAFAWLERARPPTSNPAESYPNWALRETLQAEPHLIPLHADPRWQTFLQALDQ